jgi:hypothetical protein
MILGMSTSAFTLLHVALSLVGILAGFVVVAAMFGAKAVSGWTALFLITTVLTSVTGFLFPADKVLPSHVVGVVSLAVLIIAIVALYGARLARSWRWIYVVAAVISLYLNVFVLVAQAFQKVGFLHALAPTGSEPAFIAAQVIVLAIFIALGIKAVKSFHPNSSPAELRPA